MKSVSRSAVRPPDPLTLVQFMQPEIVPHNDRLGMVGLSIVESRKGNKEAKTTLHACAVVMESAIKKNPEQGTRSGCCLNSVGT